jgi:hypothetical protein
MTTTTFIDNTTPIISSWLNDVNKFVYSGTTQAGTTYSFGGTTVSYSDTGIIASFASTVAGYNQVILQNKSAATNASTNFNVSNNSGTASTNFGEFGMNSSTYTGSGPFSQAGYVYLASASTDLVVGTYGANTLRFATNGVEVGSVSSAGVWSINYTQGGTGAVTGTVQRKLQESVSVYDFMTPAQVAAAKAGDYSLDVTSCFTAAMGTGNREIFVPAGKYRVNDLRWKRGVVLRGEGTANTFLRHTDPTKHCIYIYPPDDATQFYGIGILDLSVMGMNNASALSSVRIEALAPYVVCFSTFRFNAGGDNSMIRADAVSTALELVNGSASEVYSNTFDIMCWGSTGTAFITTGVYNEYWLESVASGNAHALADSSQNSTFHYLVSDGQLYLGGATNTFFNPTVEDIWGTPVETPAGLYCIDVTGYHHTLIGPCVTTVTDAKANYGIRVLQACTLLEPKMYASTCRYPLWLTAGTSGLVTNATMNASCEGITSQATLANWTLAGDCSSAFPTYYQDKYIGTALVNQLLTRAPAPTLTITSNTITPTKLVSFVGAGLIKTITVPALAASGGATITLIPTAAFTTDATGNIAIASTAVIGKQMLLTYDSTTTKWYPSY